MALRGLGRVSTAWRGAGGRRGGRAGLRARAEKGKGGGFGLFDEILDTLEGGKKLRKWYGDDSSVGRKRAQQELEEAMAEDFPEGLPEPADDASEPAASYAPAGGAGGTVLVAGAELALGGAVVMQLILAERPVRALVRDATKAAKEFGPYVECTTSKAEAALFDGVGSVVVVGDDVSQIAAAAVANGVGHLVLVSSVEDSTGLFANDEAKALCDRSREAAVASAARSGLPCTVVRCGKLDAAPGGRAGVQLGPEGSSGSGASLSREDAAAVAVAALSRPPPQGAPSVVEAVNSGAAPAAPLTVEDWESKYAEAVA